MILLLRLVMVVTGLAGVGVAMFLYASTELPRIVCALPAAPAIAVFLLAQQKIQELEYDKEQEMIKKRNEQ